MVPKFLIDECLSPTLALLARDRGYVESSHVTWIGKGSWKDWELRRVVTDGDWTFVTRNSIDFRGLAERPGTQGEYSHLPLHAGLVCINGPEQMKAEAARVLFGLVLNIVGTSQMTNEVIEITFADGDTYEIIRYDLPSKSPEP